jgi:hypothetical protein
VEMGKLGIEKCERFVGLRNTACDKEFGEHQREACGSGEFFSLLRMGLGQDPTLARTAADGSGAILNYAQCAQPAYSSSSSCSWSSITMS